MGADLIRKRPNELLRPWSRLTVILCLWSSQFPHLRSEKAAVRQTQRTLAQTGQYRLCQCDLAGGVSPAVRRCPWSRPAPTCRGVQKRTFRCPAGALNKLVDPVTRGDPESPLRWTSKSTTRLAPELKQGGHAVSQRRCLSACRGDGRPERPSPPCRRGSR